MSDTETLVLASLDADRAVFTLPSEIGYGGPSVRHSIRRSRWIDLGRPIELHVAVVVP